MVTGDDNPARRRPVASCGTGAEEDGELTERKQRPEEKKRDWRRGQNGEALRVNGGRLLPRGYGGNGAVDGMGEDGEDTAEPVEIMTQLDDDWSGGELTQVHEEDDARAGSGCRGTAAEDLLDTARRDRGRARWIRREEGHRSTGVVELGCVPDSVGKVGKEGRERSESTSPQLTRTGGCRGARGCGIEWHGEAVLLQPSRPEVGDDPDRWAPAVPVGEREGTAKNGLRGRQANADGLVHSAGRSWAGGGPTKEGIRLGHTSSI
ncbi:hypothetical protein E2562_032977 [Oryza meyeriana var. granulata]|uniref:Uncharacterized protein n=1 Tax=Oryza meyeriana var. granulata TaxID=110450 RepID=A0A6G1D962_9ORYZ|nr:hypothetical protein E2562_032977 [Oryza meyeriana var. granulata]